MTAEVAERPLLGSQDPVISSVPEYRQTSGPEIVDLARLAGLVLDPWQELVLRDAMGERRDGRWAAFEAAVIVGRQNGKSAIFEARMLAGLFLLGEELIIYSAHEFKTAQEIFRRMEEMISGNAMFSRRVKSVSRSKGDEGIELTTRQRLRFVARSTGSGRGFSGDCNIWDECQNLGEGPVDALMPTMSARRNPQLWYGGSAPDKDMAPCDQIARVRRRALKNAPSLAYFEWSADLCTDQCPDDCRDHDDPADPQVWAKTNPGLGIRIDRERIEREYESMSPKGFARERLSVGNWPSEHGDQFEVIPEEIWRELGDPIVKDESGNIIAGSQATEKVAFSLAAAPSGRYASIGVASPREDGLLHVEVVDYWRGTSWVVERAVQLRDAWGPVVFVVDPGGPAGFLIADLEAAGVEVTKMTARDVAQACGGLVAACGVAEGDEAVLRHIPHPALDAAVAGATTKALGDGWKWVPRSPSVDISPLQAITQARWGLVTAEDDEEAPEPWVMFG